MSYPMCIQKNPQLPNMEFGRRLAVEKEIEKTSTLPLANALFDYSGHFLFYATMMGVKGERVIRCSNTLHNTCSGEPDHQSLCENHW
jgi:hypothetical protein